MKIYLAGKVDPTHGSWRDAILGTYYAPELKRQASRWVLTRSANETDLNGELRAQPWPRLPNTHVLGLHEYVGPYRTIFAPEALDTKYLGVFHGTEGWGQHGGEFSYGEDRTLIVRECRAAIERADLVFAYINTPDCFGTLAEIGMAAAMGTFVAVATTDVAGDAYDDFWFIESLADVSLWHRPVSADSPIWPAESDLPKDDSGESAFQVRLARQRAQANTVDELRTMVQTAIVHWAARKPNAMVKRTLTEADLYHAVAEVERRYAGTFAQIAQWTSDPRVRDAARRMLRQLPS